MSVLRIRCYDVGADWTTDDPICIVPDQTEASFTDLLNEVGSFQVAVPRRLTTLLPVTRLTIWEFEVDGTVRFRGLLWDVRDQPIAEDETAVNRVYTGYGIGKWLESGTAYPDRWGLTRPNDEPVKRYEDVTPGEVLQDQWTKALARGAFGPLTVTDWDDTEDSKEVAYPENIVALDVRPGTSFLDLLSQVCAENKMDWWVDPDGGVHVYVIDAVTEIGKGTDQSADADCPRLMAMRNLIEARQRDFVEEVGSVVLVEGVSDPSGTDPEYWEYEDEVALGNWGRWERYLADSSIESEGEANQAGEAAMADWGVEQTNLSLAIREVTGAMPYVDFVIGDKIRVHAPSDGINDESRRVSGITLDSRVDEETGWLLEFDDADMTAEMRASRRLAKLDNQNHWHAGDLGHKGPDRTSPDEPLNFAADTETYQDANEKTVAFVNLEWELPEYQGVPGVKIKNLAYFVVQYRRHDEEEEPNTGWTKYGRVDEDEGDGETPEKWRVRIDPLPIGVSYDFRVRAITKTRKKGLWATDEENLTGTDSTVPETPHAPQMRGVGSSDLTVLHTLEDVDHVLLDRDVTKLVVYISPVTPVVVSKDNRAGIIPVTPEDFDSGNKVHRRFTTVGVEATQVELVRGTDYYAAVKAVDDAGNVSDLSAEIGPIVAGDYVAPTTPVGLAVEVYTIEGKFGSLRASWTAHTAKDLHHYVIRYRRVAAGEKWNRLPRADADDTEIIADHLLTGKTYRFQIRAVDVHSNRSAWSDNVDIETKWGLTGPDVPPAPTVTAVPGGFDITFDLATWGPDNPEAKKIRVYCGSTPEPTHTVGRIMLDYDDDLEDGDPVTLEWRPGIVPGATYYARGKAYDWAGNPSQA